MFNGKFHYFYGHFPVRHVCSPEANYAKNMGVNSLLGQADTDEHAKLDPLTAWLYSYGTWP